MKNLTITTPADRSWADRLLDPAPRRDPEDRGTMDPIRAELDDAARSRAAGRRHSSRADVIVPAHSNGTTHSGTTLDEVEARRDQVRATFPRVAL